MGRPRSLLSLVCGVLLMATASLSAQDAGTAAPDFTLRTLTGDTITLSSLKGKAVFLNFWATWCRPCRAEMTDIIGAYVAHTDQRLVVLAINLTDQERLVDVRRFATELQLPFPVLLDRKGKVRRTYRLRGVPTSVFIDTLGVVRFVQIGQLTAEKLQRGLFEILPVR